MNRIDQLFKKKQEDILSVYCSAGYPQLNDTVPVIRALEDNGVDMVEIGMPFSDPMADGPVIQQSNQQALENGMTLNFLFHQLRDIRTEISIPLILMGYLNPILQFGVEHFCQKSYETGIDGVILPDMPVDEYLEHYQHLFTSYGLHTIFLISPQTSEERIHKIVRAGSGFIYMVSSASTTGAKHTITPEQERYFNKINNMNLDLPIMVGFGISNHETFRTVCQYANGAIIGSAFIKALTQPNDLATNIRDFVHSIRHT